VPLGGLGAGSIGRTHRGDFARWHLDVGRHRFETIPADQFSVYVARTGKFGHVRRRSVRESPELNGTAAGRRHVPRLFPYAWFEYDWAEPPSWLLQRQFSPVIPATTAKAATRSASSMADREPGPGSVTVG